jgi:hypothetical protein
MIEISEKFEDTRKGNGIAILNRFSVSLDKGSGEHPPQLQQPDRR